MAEQQGQLAIMCGLPKSGKSTYARTLKDEGWVVISPDQVRLAMHGQQFHNHAEPFVWAVVDCMARSLLNGEHRVVVDATHTTERRRQQWVKMAQEFGMVLQVYVLETTPEECLARNGWLQRNGGRSVAVPEGVITRMAEAWEPPQSNERIQVIEVGVAA